AATVSILPWKALMVARNGALDCRVPTFILSGQPGAGLALASRQQKTETVARMKTVAVIPARLASTRLPPKALLEIAGRPLMVHVYDAVQSCGLLDEVMVATDSEEVLEVCRRNGCKAQMTSSVHRSGTERVHEISESVKADIYINVQGDEPL